jgi:hypothetical protein
MAVIARVGSETGPSALDTGPQKLAITTQAASGLPGRGNPGSGQANRLTRLVTGRKVSRR